MTLCSLNESIIWNLPDILLIKDNNSKYLLSNKTSANLLGFQNLNELIGESDYDIRCDAVTCADQFIYEDQYVQKKDVPLSILYINKYADNSIKLIRMTKKNIKNHETGKYEGLICKGELLNNKQLEYFSNILMLTDSRYKGTKYGSYYLNIKTDSDIKLTKKQQIVLFYTLRGCSAKEISQLLNQSCRTIEHHLNSIKTKFNCTTKSQMIEKAINNGFINLLPLEIINDCDGDNFNGIKEITFKK